MEFNSSTSTSSFLTSQFLYNCQSPQYQQSQILNFAEFLPSVDVDVDEISSNHDHDQSLPLPLLIKEELDNIEETIRAVGSYCYDEEPELELPEQDLGSVKLEPQQQSSLSSSSLMTADNGQCSVSEAFLPPSAIQTTTTNTSETATIPKIGSRNSAFLPFKPITVLTNLQRGNVKTLNKEISLQPLTLHEKAARGDLSMEDLNGPDNIDFLDCKGRTMLHWASFHSRLESVQMLVEQGSNINHCNPKGQTPLMFAAANGNVEIINYLLSKAVDLEITDESGNTAIFFATIANHAPSVSALLKSGASMLTSNYNDDTILNIAISKNLTAAQYAMENYLRDFFEANYVIKSE